MNTKNWSCFWILYSRTRVNQFLNVFLFVKKIVKRGVKVCPEKFGMVTGCFNQTVRWLWYLAFFFCSSWPYNVPPLGSRLLSAWPPPPRNRQQHHFWPWLIDALESQQGSRRGLEKSLQHFIKWKCLGSGTGFSTYSFLLTPVNVL